MSWGHDEYGSVRRQRRLAAQLCRSYHFLKHNKAALPEQAFWITRYHSFYAWYVPAVAPHDPRCAGTKAAHIVTCATNKTRRSSSGSRSSSKHCGWHALLVIACSKFDLYSKSDAVPDVKKLRPYYQSLIDKFLPGTLEF